jgi:hypothetical protein
VSARPLSCRTSEQLRLPRSEPDQLVNARSLLGERHDLFPVNAASFARSPRRSLVVQRHGLSPINATIFPRCASRLFAGRQPRQLACRNTASRWPLLGKSSVVDTAALRRRLESQPDSRPASVPTAALHPSRQPPCIRPDSRPASVPKTEMKTALKTNLKTRGDSGEECIECRRSTPINGR